jgi:uncharacterized hydrophobic protein (TIGR00271 family)
MIHLRLIVPADIAAATVERLRATSGVAHLAHVPGAAVSPSGDLVLCDVAREAANDVIEWLQDRDIHHRGAITVEALEAVVSDAAAAADESAPGRAADSLIWEEIEDKARSDGALSTSFIVFITLASVVGGIAIVLDSPILLVGAMVVGPEYAPLSALCVAAARLRRGAALRAAMTLAIGLAAAAAAALVSMLALRAAGIAPDSYGLDERELTAFIARPDAMAAVVAVVAGVLGMLAITQSRSTALTGVLVSATTLPAVSNIGVATAFAEWSDVGGAALQLLVNVVGLVVAGITTLVVQSRATSAAPAHP